MRRIKPGQIVLLGFAGFIALGTLLLWLPVSRTGDEPMAWKAALFTSTSAVCVTGHAIVDTSTYWSRFGQVVIMGLIQVGGFGIVMAASVLLLAARRNLGLRGRMLTQSESQAVTSSDVRRVLASVALFTVVVEALIAVTLTLRFWLGYGLSFGDAVWHGVFHAISAFNNAGFALYSDNLMGFQSDGWILIPIGLAVIIGGLGFPVFSDLHKRRRRLRRLTLHSKITLTGTALLLFGGMFAFLATEWDNDKTLGPMSLPSKLLSAWFQSMTTRTAGFNSISIGDMRDESWLLSDMLMFVGGGSGSTAGGVKVATFAILILIVLGEARGGQPPEAFRRRIPVPALRQSLSVAFLAINAITIATLALMMLTPYALDRCIFEVISAFSTVGLSTGITADLGTPGQLILVGLMYLGRVGPLALVLALARRETQRLYDYPEESPLVG